MSSLRRILASRANGARSTGPVTAAGKKRSSANSLSHGLLAKSIVLQSEPGERERLASAFTTLASQPQLGSVPSVPNEPNPKIEHSEGQS